MAAASSSPHREAAAHVAYREMGFRNVYYRQAWRVRIAGNVRRGIIHGRRNMVRPSSRYVMARARLARRRRRLAINHRSIKQLRRRIGAKISMPGSSASCRLNSANKRYAIAASIK